MKIVRRKKTIIVLVCLLVIIGSAIVMMVMPRAHYESGEKFADPETLNAKHRDRTVLVHMKSGLKPDDTQPCVAFNMVAGLVRSGYKVAILIDARANADFIGSSPDESKWGQYKLPEALVHAVSYQLSVPFDQFPKTYMDYLEWLVDQGASVYMNGTMNILNGTASRIRNQPLVPPFIELLTFPEMARLLAESELYIAY